MRSIKKRLTLLLVAVLLMGLAPEGLAGGYAFEGTGATAFVGSGNRLYITDAQGLPSSMPLVNEAIQSVVYVSDASVFFLMRDDAIQTTEDSWDPEAWKLMSVPLAGGEPTLISKGIRGDAVYIDADRLIYFVHHEDPSMLHRFSVIDNKEMEPVELPTENAKLTATMDGLAISNEATGEGLLYVRATNQLVSANLYAAGEYDDFVDFETVRSDSSLRIRIKGSNVWQIVDGQAYSCARIGNNLYYTIRNLESGEVLVREYSPATNQIRNVVKLVGYSDQITVADGRLFAIAIGNKISEIDPATGKATDFMKLDALGINSPRLVALGRNILIFDDQPDEENNEAKPEFVQIVNMEGKIVVSADEIVPEGAFLLKRGSKGSEVRTLQQRLIDLGYLNDYADGSFGAKTETAVRRFQDGQGLKQTGTVNQSLYDAIIADSAPSYVPYVPLRRGDTGIRVEELQSRLAALKYPVGAADGIFGSRTARSVSLFQGDNGYDEDGVASTAMQRLLFSSDADSYERFVELRSGDTGERVSILQRRLKELKYYDGTITGNYVSKTVTAVKRFQQVLEIEQTGVASVNLLKMLFDADAPSNRPDPTPTPAASPTPTPAPSVAPTPTPELTEAPTASPDPTEAPTPTPELTEAPTPTPELTEAPTPTPDPTEAPTPTPEVTEEPTPTPDPTEEPTLTPDPTEAPTPTPPPFAKPGSGALPINDQSKPDDIKWVQWRLIVQGIMKEKHNDAGGNELTYPTGLFDEYTIECISKYETDILKRATPTGVVDQDMINALEIDP